MFTPSLPFSRSQMLKTATCGFGYLAFAGLATEASAAYQDPLAAKMTHFAARAKRVIFICMRGGPSHVDTFDYKPKLYADAGKTSSSGGAAGLDRNRGRTLLAHRGKVSSVCFSPDGKRLASASSGLKVWDAASGQVALTLEEYGTFRSVCFSPDGKHLVSVCDNGTVRVWTAATEEEVARHEASRSK